MKLIYTTILLLILISTGNKKNKEDCYPDKGIKIARIYGKTKHPNMLKNKNLNEIREIKFNEDGQPIVIRNTKGNVVEQKREYKNGKLQLIITTRKKLPDFYDSDKLDSLTKKANIITDTTTIVSHHNDGRPIKINNPDGSTMIFSYTDCNKELQTILNQKGDTIRQFHSINKDGVLIETNWISFFPIKSSRISKYFGYKFDKHGNWVKRNYMHQDGPTISETRKLTYY